MLLSVADPEGDVHQVIIELIKVVIRWLHRFADENDLPAFKESFKQKKGIA
jgi:hypothetical protein